MNMSILYQYPKWRACVILISLGIVFLFYGSTNLVRDYNSLHWPSTSGIIRSAKTSHAFWAYHGFSYADILYDYRVASVSYSGIRVSFGGFWQHNHNENEVRLVLNRYPQGKEVAVFYDPNDPNNAVLEPQITDRTWTPLALGVAFLLWGTLPIVFFLRRARHGKIDVF
jgi:hypothetical protein